MGLCASDMAAAGGDDTAKKADRAISGQINKDKQADLLVNKLLLLGAGGSGKSTLFKQMIKIYGRGFPEKERKLFTYIIYNNIIIAMQTLCTESEKYGPVADNLRSIREEVLAIKEGDPVTPPIGEKIGKLWQDPGIQTTFSKRSAFQLQDSAMYFFSRLEEVQDPGYIPTEQDVLRSRVPTTGIVENEFIIEKSVFKMYDVGGQRSERKKWIHCFENVTAVLFVCAISAYDQVLYEDDSTNRVHESLVLFKEIANSNWFRDTSMILFLNKRDLFKEKLKTVPLSRYFPDYEEEAGLDHEAAYDAAYMYIRARFEALSQLPNKLVYTHLTCATDTGNIQAVFNAVKDIVIKKGLSRAGLM